MPDLTFLTVPNELWIASAALVAATVLLTTIRIVHWRAVPTGKHETAAHVQAVQGLKYLRFWGCVSAFVSLFLSIMFTTKVPHGNFDRDAFNKGVWAAVRMVFTIVIGLAAYLFDASPKLRQFCCLVTPLLVVLDMVSQMDFAQDVYCLVEDYCVPSHSLSESTLTGLVFRDLIAMVTDITVMTLSFWLIAYHGVTANRVYMPRKEHRELSRALSRAGIEVSFTKNQKLVDQRAAAMKVRQHLFSTAIDTEAQY